MMKYWRKLIPAAIGSKRSEGRKRSFNLMDLCLCVAGYRHQPMEQQRRIGVDYEYILCGAVGI